MNNLMSLALGLSFSVALSSMALAEEAYTLRVTNGILRQPSRLSAVISQEGCTGTFVSPTTILTAAHCAGNGFTFNGVRTSSFQSMGEYFGVPWNTDNDVRVLVFPKAVAPAWVPVANEGAFQGLHVVVAGFGAYDVAGNPLKDFRFRFGTNKVASFYYGNNRLLEVHGTKFGRLDQIEGSNSNVGPGDSGGPLLWNGIITGIASGVFSINNQTQGAIYVNLTNPDVRNYLNAQVRTRGADIRFGGEGSIPYSECKDLDPSQRDFTFVFDVPHSNIRSMAGEGGAHMRVFRKVSGEFQNNNFSEDNAMNSEFYTFSAPSFGARLIIQDGQPTPRYVCFI